MYVYSFFTSASFCSELNLTKLYEASCYMKEAPVCVCVLHSSYVDYLVWITAPGTEMSKILINIPGESLFDS